MKNKKKLHEFLYFKSIANFEAFHLNFSSSTNPQIVRSETYLSHILTSYPSSIVVSPGKALLCQPWWQQSCKTIDLIHHNNMFLIPIMHDNKHQFTCYCTSASSCCNIFQEWRSHSNCWWWLVENCLFWRN